MGTVHGQTNSSTLSSFVGLVVRQVTADQPTGREFKPNTRTSWLHLLTIILYTTFVIQRIEVAYSLCKVFFLSTVTKCDHLI